MADRYAILPAATTSLWSATSTWSAASGGATGASVPTSGDNVIVDAASVAGASAILSVDANANCLDMDWTGATNTPTIAMNNIVFSYGDITLISAMVMSGASYLRPASNFAQSLTCNGLVLDCNLLKEGAGLLTLIDELNIGTHTFVNYRAVDTNDQTVTCGQLYDVGAAISSTLICGASTINCTSFSFTATGTVTVTLGSATINCSSFAIIAGATVAANTSTINCSGNFAGGGITTYNNVNLNGTAHTISGNNTIVTLRLLPVGIQTITFTDGSTQTVTSFYRSAGVSIITLQGTGVAGWNIAKVGGGVIELDYLSISYSAASPAATWYAGLHSTDVVGNSGWAFNNFPSQRNLANPRVPINSLRQLANTRSLAVLR